MPVIDLGSVVGPTGATGATGATGPQGIQGNPGPNQVTANTSTTLNGLLHGNGNNITAEPFTIERGTDLNTLVVPGFYRCGSASAAAEMINAPVTDIYYTMVVSKISETTRQQLLYTPTDMYMRTISTSSGVLYQWRKIGVKQFEASVSMGTDVELFRITDPLITSSTFVVSCSFADQRNIQKLEWESYAGYISFIGTCSYATTTAYVILSN